MKSLKTEAGIQSEASDPAVLKSCVNIVIVNLAACM